MKVHLDTHHYKDEESSKSLVNICIFDIEDTSQEAIGDAVDSALGVFERVILLWREERQEMLEKALIELEEKKKGNSA